MPENSDLTDLEQRLSAALERIGTALEGLVRPAPVAEPVPDVTDVPESGTETAADAPSAPADETPRVPAFDTAAAAVGETSAADRQELEHLRAALEDERIVTAQLEERIRRLKARGGEGDSALRGELDNARAALARMDADLQGLRAANTALRDAASALRAAAEAGVPDAGLINRTLEAELAALAATRNADAAEAEAILTAMAPLLAAPVETAQTEEV